VPEGGQPDQSVEDPFAQGLDTTEQSGLAGESASSGEMQPSESVEDPFSQGLDTTEQSAMASESVEDPFAQGVDTTEQSAMAGESSSEGETQPSESVEDLQGVDQTEQSALAGASSPGGETKPDQAVEDPFAREPTEGIPEDPLSGAPPEEASSSTDQPEMDISGEAPGEEPSEGLQDGELDEMLQEYMGEDAQEDVSYTSELERIMANNIKTIMKQKDKDELVRASLELEEMTEELQNNVEYSRNTLFLEIADRKSPEKLVDYFRNKMARFAFPCLTKALVSCDILRESDSNDIKDFVQMYQFNADLFDFVTPALLYAEVFKKKEDPIVQDQSQGVSKIEERVLQDELYDENNVSLLAIAYMHPSVLDTKNLSSLSNSELKGKVFKKINEIVFNKSLDSYKKYALLERLSKLVYHLNDSDKLMFKDNVLNLSPGEVDEFKELYSEFVDLEITPPELRTDTDMQSTGSQKVGFCKELNDNMMDELRERRPFSLTEEDAFKHTMCKKENYDKTVETLSHLPEMVEKIKEDAKKELEKKETITDSDIDSMTTEKAEKLKEDIEEQLRLIRETKGEE